MRTAGLNGGWNIVYRCGHDVSRMKRGKTTLTQGLPAPGGAGPGPVPERLHLEAMNRVGRFAGHRGGSMTGAAEAGLAPESRMTFIHCCRCHPRLELPHSSFRTGLHTPTLRPAGVQVHTERDASSDSDGD